MTSPTPEQMRALAAKMLATADWVRDEMPDLAEEMEDGTIALRAAADEVDRLRAVIENAPHVPACNSNFGTPGRWPCTCWKADVL